MKKKWNKVTAALLMLVMVVTTVLGAAPALSVKAEPVTMGHLKSGSGNANDISEALHLKHLFCQKKLIIQIRHIV